MSIKGFPKLRHHAAGIDIGTTNLHVSVDGETVKVFQSFTESIVELVKYLKDESVETVAMEATGVLWIPLYDMIEAAGIEVYLVNGSHVKNIPAQKSDILDSCWLQQTHSCGLLRASFIPKEEIRELRTYVRQRENLIELGAQNIQRMQKAFELMNIKLHNVISDIKGKSGMLIIESILSGERNVNKLLNLCDKRIKKHKAEQVKLSLSGNYKKEYIFMLRQAYETYQFFQEQIYACDKEIEIFLKKLTETLPEPPKTPSSPSRHNKPDIEDLHKQVVQMLDGRDATVLPGLSDKTMLKLVAELGTDLSQWPTEKHFTSWLGLSPRKKQSGKMSRIKRYSAKTVAGQIFRESAYSIANSKYIALKGFYNRIKSKNGYKTAIKATARKIAVLYYRFIVNGLEFVEKGLQEYEEKYKQIMFRNITRKAKEIGYELVSVN
jgi:transposase